MKRKSLRLFLLLALIAPWSAKAQQYVTIGNLQSPFSTGLLPVATGWYYSLSQQIYTSDEIGMAGYISSIAFEYIVNESFSIDSVQVYMKNVSKSYFESNTDMVSLDGATKVFEGTFTVQGPGWVTIQFDTPFFYDGTSNLLLCCYDPTEGLIQWNSELWFRTTKANSNRSICYYSNEYCPDINDLSNYQGYYANDDYNISNIQLVIFPYIYFQDQLVEEICLEYWDFNHDNNLSYAEAAAVTTLGLNFKDKNGINHLDILEYFTGLSTLHRYEFQNCEWLEEIAIPRAVSQIDPSIFDGCSRLQYITVDPSNTTYTSLNGCNGIFKNLGDGYKLVAGCKSTVIPEGVTAIGEGALENLPMSTLTLPSTLQTIESYGIHQIDGLESLTVNAVTPPSITEYFLYGTPRTIPVIVPVESLAAYHNYNNGQPWGGFTNIIADGNISFVDSAVKAICVANWDTNDDGELSYAEAAAVTTLNPSGIWDNSVFKSNTTITSFDELQYFNGLTNTGGCAFEGCEHLTSITLPPNLERIGSGAFRHCHNLSSVDIPNSVTFIGSYAFEDCVQLTSITLPPNLERIESRAFNLCYNLSSVSIPDGVTLIGVLAFSYCQLTSIDIPNSVTQIGSLVFRGCPLSSVNIPASVRIIDSNPFYGCEPLASITVDAGNPVYSSPNGCNAIIKTDEHRLISGCKNTVIPNDVTEINDFAFSDCTGLSSIEIPASVEIINDYAFKGCFNLEYITVLAETPPSISIYSENCFNGVPSTIPVYVPYQSVSAYKNATGWNHFTNFIGIVTIGDETSINTDYTLPVNMDYNYSLSQQIYTAEEIGTTGALTSIAFDYTNTLPFTTEGMKVYMKNVDKTTFDSDTDMVDLSDATLVYDGTFAASGAGWVRLQLQTPFYYDGNSNLLLCCYDPTDGYLGNEIEFRLTTTGDNYTALTYFSDEYNPDINDISSFAGVKYRIKNRNNIYLAINPNIQFADAAVKTICVDNWDSNGDGELSYTEAAAVTSLGEVFKNNDNITSFNELQYFTGLTSIEPYAFYGCNNLTSVILPPGVTSIGNSAFYNCSGLTSVTIGNSVTSIGDSAFNHCTSLTSVTIGNSATSIGSYAFGSCSGLTSVTIPDSVTSIGSFAFYNCSGLTSITIGNSVTSIDAFAFQKCTSLTSVTIPASVTSISTNPFSDCTLLESITVDPGNTVYSSPNGCNAIIKTADHRLVLGCKNTVIPNDVTTINSYAFGGCIGLTSIEIPASVSNIYAEAFYGCSNLEGIRVWAVTPPAIYAICFYNVPYDIPVYVPMGSLADYQNYNNSYGYTSWGNFTNFIGIVTIGDEASNYTHYTLPVNMYYNYSLTQQIYTAEEIGTSGAITSIAFDYINTLHFTTEGMKVYMKNVNKTTFDSDTDMVDLSDATLVYDGNFAASGAGWVSLQLQTPFYYDGNSNLLLCCYDPTDDYPGYQIIFRQTTTDDNYTALTYHSDLYNPDINNISSFDGEKYRLKYRNNIYLAINPNIQFADDAVKAICVASSTGWDTNGDGELSYAEAAVVMTLGETFNGKTNITSFNELQYFDRLISIDDEAFSGCWSLAAVTLPPALQTIGEFSFYGCNFPSIVIPNSVTSIDSHAFRSCGALTSITIPSSVTSIGENPFFSCPALASIMVEAGNTVYSSPEGSNAIINTEEHKLVSGCKNTVIPEGVTTIGASAFGGCSDLTEIHIPSSVTLIDAWAFNSCSGLTEVTIPSSVNYIGNAAFYGCTGLTSITVEATTPPTLDNGAFDNVPVSIPVYVPCGTLEDYQSAAGWNDFTNLVDPCASQPQVVTLAAGTNWFSSNVEITLADLQNALTDVLGTNASITISSQTQSCTLKRNRWTGTLETIDLSQMYMIEIENACEFSLEGEPINPANHPVIISFGENWVAFPLHVAMSLDEAFDGFAQNDDAVSSQTQNASRKRNKWTGTLTELQPGQGFIYTSSVNGDRTLVFPTSK